MKKTVAAILAIGSGIGLFIPDLLPLIDEGIFFIIFINALSMLGFDLRRFVGMKGGKKKPEKPIDIG